MDSLPSGSVSSEVGLSSLPSPTPSPLAVATTTETVSKPDGVEPSEDKKLLAAILVAGVAAIAALVSESKRVQHEQARQKELGCDHSSHWLKTTIVLTRKGAYSMGGRYFGSEGKCSKCGEEFTFNEYPH